MGTQNMVCLSADSAIWLGGSASSSVSHMRLDFKIRTDDGR